MRVLVACEFSGIVRDAFRFHGHDAWSCDFLPTEQPGPHYQCDIRDIIFTTKWDLLIAHPPCTNLSSSGARWFRYKNQSEDLNLINLLLSAPVKRRAIENPIGIISTQIRKPDQIIQPWQFGIGDKKATCLWLENLPLLIPTHIVSGRNPRIHHMSPGPERWKNRSRTYLGIALAMAEQWGVS